MQTSASVEETSDEQFYEKVYRRSHSQRSVNLAKLALKQFDNFCLGSYGCSKEQIIKEVKEDEKKRFKVLDRFASYLDSRQKQPNTIHGYMNVVKKYFRFHEIKIYNEDFRQEITLPRIRKYHDEPLTREIIQRILNVSNPRLKTLILLLCSSGMRVGEALALRVRDISFDSRPTCIRIPPSIAKTSEGRETFITEEATITLKDYLGYKIKRLDAYVFGQYNNLQSAQANVITNFRNAMRKLADLNDTIDDNPSRYKIHIHSFRKFFYSTVATALNPTVAHAWMGHSDYLDTYFRKTFEERCELYLQVEPHLTISNAEAVLKEVKHTQQEMRQIRQKLAEFDELKELLAKHKILQEA